jgi:hypothetical protein
MDTTPGNRKIEIEHKTLKLLDHSRKWSMFLAIVGFIFLGLVIVVGVIAGSFLSAFGSGKTGLGISEISVFIIFLIMAVIYFFPVLFLFRYSKHTARAVETLDKMALHKAFKNLKYFFTYLGVLIIMLLALYVAALIVSGTSLSFLKGFD